jgi:hypothetical protein
MGTFGHRDLPKRLVAGGLSEELDQVAVFQSPVFKGFAEMGMPGVGPPDPSGVPKALVFWGVWAVSGLPLEVHPAKNGIFGPAS